jgi:undecaprenyl diphosphate synthase
LQRLVNWSLSKGIPELSVFAWSSENWSRPKEEIDGAMEQFDKALDQCLADEQRDIAYIFISTSKEKLSSTLRIKMH